VPLLALQIITVIDADTVERGGERWRTDGIDAPEIHGARCAAERQAGIVAAARLVALLAEAGGRLIETGREKYGRRRGRLMLGWPSTGERDWAAIAVAEGYAVAYSGKGPRHDWCR
jgi:endonuclease YncB( thermonuclease family)